MLRFWKHRGRKFEDVAAMDRGYCAWVLREKALPLHAFYRYLIEVRGGVLQVGKHKGRFFDEGLEGAPEYCDWALSLEDPSDSLVLFIDYARVHKASEQSAKKPRTTRKPASSVATGPSTQPSSRVSISSLVCLVLGNSTASNAPFAKNASRWF